MRRMPSTGSLPRRRSGDARTRTMNPCMGAGAGRVGFRWGQVAGQAPPGYNLIERHPTGGARVLREALKQRIDELSDEEVAALAILLGPSEDELAAASATLQAELAAAGRGELETTPLGEVARRLGRPGV